MDSVTITITLPGRTAKWFRTMCSLGRLCDEIGRGVDEDAEEYDIACAEESLAELKTHLMALESPLRNALVDAGVEKAWRNGTEGDDNGPQ